jgi:hypothetical protein
MEKIFFRWNMWKILAFAVFRSAFVGCFGEENIQKIFRKNPEDIFDEFSAESVNAASIGQVHTAKKGKRNWQ